MMHFLMPSHKPTTLRLYGERIEQLICHANDGSAGFGKEDLKTWTALIKKIASIVLILTRTMAP